MMKLVCTSTIFAFLTTLSLGRLDKTATVRNVAEPFEDRHQLQQEPEICVLLDCCEAECCGPNTIWVWDWTFLSFLCAREIGAPGWLGPPNDPPICTDDWVCCEEACCAPGTHWEAPRCLADSVDAYVVPSSCVETEAPTTSAVPNDSGGCFESGSFFANVNYEGSVYRVATPNGNFPLDADFTRHADNRVHRYNGKWSYEATYNVAIDENGLKDKENSWIQLHRLCYTFNGTIMAKKENDHTTERIPITGLIYNSNDCTFSFFNLGTTGGEPWVPTCYTDLYQLYDQNFVGTVDFSTNEIEWTSQYAEFNGLGYSFTVQGDIADQSDGCEE